jgi:hypothetical protein
MKNHTTKREHLHIRSIVQPPLPAKKKLPTKLVVEKTKYKKSNCTALWLFFFCNSGQSPIEPAGDNLKNYELPKQRTK